MEKGRTYEIRWTRKAQKDLAKLPRDIQAKVTEKIDDLATQPRPHGTKPLRGEYTELWSLRVTIRYRVIYSIDDAAPMVLIVKVSSREGAYD